MRISPILPLLVLLSGTLTGCEQFPDSTERLNAIPFGGTNEANIAAMVANPMDLVRGRGQDESDSKSAVTAILHVQTDTPKKLPTSGQSEGGGGGGGSGGGSGGGGGGGGGGG